jgi:hypothetical protein
MSVNSVSPGTRSLAVLRGPILKPRPRAARERSCSSCAGTCAHLTCKDIGAKFGTASDGCGDVFECSGCYCPWEGESCWGAVTMPPYAWLNMACCGAGYCTPATCE